MQKNLIAPLIIGALILSSGSFYVGMQYQKSHTPPSTFQRTGGMGNFAGRGGNGNGGPQGRGSGFAGNMTAGQVVSKTDNSLTVQLRDGSSKIIIYSTSTRVGKAMDGSITDVNTGAEVAISGSTNPDGSITASMIQIRPQTGTPPINGTMNNQQQATPQQP